jgi:hypothetical protein
MPDTQQERPPKLLLVEGNDKLFIEQLNIAYFGRIRPPISIESVHAFRGKSTTHYGGNRPA